VRPGSVRKVIRAVEPGVPEALRGFTKPPPARPIEAVLPFDHQRKVKHVLSPSIVER